MTARSIKVGAGLFSAALLAAALYIVLRPESTVQTYATSPVTRGDLVATVSATGGLSPLVTVQVGSQVSGTIASLHADFNTRVKTGDVIARIEPSLFEAEVAQAEANLKSAEAQRDKAAISEEEARRNLDRLKKLREQRLVSESDLDVAEFAHRAAAVELRVRAAAVAQARAALEKAQINLAHTTIYAPVDGVVISRDVDVGQTVAASLQAPTLFTIARDLRRMQIETEVDEAFIGQVEQGQPVQFTVFAYMDRTFRGEVAQIRLNPTIESGVVKYNVIIDVDNDGLALKPGMTATVAIETARHEDVLKVPNQALRFVPDLSEERVAALRERIKAGQGVLWVREQGQLRAITVTVGIAGEHTTEVSGPGLQEGMEVAVPARNAGAGEGRRPRFGLF